MTFARNYATIADRKSKIRKEEKRTKDECRKAVRGGKSGSRPQAVQRGRLRHRRAFRFGFSSSFFSFGAWACLRRRAAPLHSSLTSSRLTATSGKPVRRVLRMDNDMKKGKHSIKSLPFQWDMKFNSISVLPDIGAIFVADAEFKVIHT